MSILTIIDGQPLFSTISEALAHGNAIGVSGYHTMIYEGQNGYMAGHSHGAATSGIPAQSQQQTTSTTTPTMTSGGGGGGGY